MKGPGPSGCVHYLHRAESSQLNAVASPSIFTCGAEWLATYGKLPDGFAQLLRGSTVT